MRGNCWSFPLTLLAGLAITTPALSQSNNKLVGCWVAVEQAEEDTFVIKDGDSICFKGRPAIEITLNFKPDNSASLTVKDGKSTKMHPFTYKLIGSRLIESRYPNGEQPVRETFTIVRNKLWLAPYPLPKHPQESIDILYTLTFVKQP